VIEENQRYTVERVVSLPLIEGNGWILDLGGGGEGVIGQACGERVVSIDRQKYELEDAPGDALKIVMDASDMQFIDNTFQTAAAFFFLFFVPEHAHEAIFKEVYRVLRPGGRLLIWDIEIPPYPGGPQTVFVVRLDVLLSDGRVVRTGYGVRWEERQRSMAGVIQTAESAGFTIDHHSLDAQVFHLIVQKPLQP
jgi:ubiquinone/menaquinone biosynthesis C-methylase UbiE